MIFTKLLEVLQWSFQKDLMLKVTVIQKSKEYFSLHQKQSIIDLRNNRSAYSKEKIMGTFMSAEYVGSVAHGNKNNLLLRSSGSQVCYKQMFVTVKDQKFQ